MKNITIHNVISEISPQIIKNKEGEKIGVFLEMHDFEQMVEALEDMHLGALATAIKKEGGPTTSIKQFERELKKLNFSATPNGV